MANTTVTTPRTPFGNPVTMKAMVTSSLDGGGQSSADHRRNRDSVKRSGAVPRSALNGI
jgi:hypothetical protein